MRKRKLTRGQKAYLNQLKKIFYSKRFTDEIKMLRERSSIPVGGYKDKERVKHRLSERSVFSYTEGPASLLKKLRKILQKFGLDNFELRPAWGFLFYGDYYLERFFKQTSHTEFADKIEFIDFVEEKEFSKGDTNWRRHFENIKKNHPIGILISPEASQRMVLDYVRENWELIEEYQKFNLKAGDAVTQQRVRPAFDRYRKIKADREKGYTYKEIATKRLKARGINEGTPEWKDKLESEEGALRSIMSKYRKASKEV